MNIQTIKNINYPIIFNKTVPSFSSASRRALSTSIQDNMPIRMYFVRMVTYPENINWAIRMNKATETISDMMKSDVDIHEILSEAEFTIRNIYLQKNKFNMSYAVRKKVRGGCFDLLNNPNTRGNEYYIKYKHALRHLSEQGFFVPQANEKYFNAITSRVTVNPYSASIFTGTNNQYNIKTNLDLVEKAYNDLKSKHAPSKKEIVETAATIQWLIAQETPYLRGSDSVANLLTRSLMHSYGLKISPLKEGVSCDFEAFYRNLDDYINIYPTLFEKNPLEA